MADTAIDIFADLTNRTFVAGLKGGAKSTALASLFHQDSLYLNIQPLTVDALGASSGSPYKVIDASNYAITVLVTKSDATTTLAGPTTITTANETAKLGLVDLNTAAMVTAFASATSVDAIIWIQFDGGALGKQTVKGTFTILKSAITSGTPAELPITSYLSRDECLALFVQFANNPDGASITLKNGAYKLILQCAADGSNASDESN